MEFIQKPIPKYVAFAAESMHADYLPVRFATEQLASKSKYYEIANQNFAYGLESLEGDFQLRDLNSALFYISQVLGYTMQQGIPEFNEYQDYPVGAVFVKDGEIYIVTKTIKGKSVPVQKYDCCGNPISTACEPVCEAPLDLTKYACKVITSCMFDPIIEALQAKDEALEGLIEDLSKIKLVANEDGSFTFTNADESTVTIPAHKASVKVTNSDGSTVHGFMHLTAEKHGEPTTTLQLIGSNELNQQKGFFYNPTSKQWEVDLADLVKDGSGLQVDKNGNISVKPSDLVDNSTLSIDPAGNIQVKPEYAEILKDGAVEEANEYTDGKLKELADKGAKVFAEAPIQGTGLKADPLTIKLSKDFKVQPDGTLVLSGGVKEATTNLNNGTGVMGMSTFYGVVNNTNGNTEYVTGVPVNINSTDHQQNGTTTIGQLAAGQNYDFNGWQIATPAQVDQWLVGVSDSVWHRTNDSGMNEDGTLKNPNNWGQWTRESNVNIPVQQFQKAIQDILALEALTSNLNQRLTAIENDIVTLWDASGTVKLGRILRAK